MTATLLVTGLFVFLAETCSLCLGTVRTIITVQGQARLALALGTLEMLIWVAGTATVMVQVSEAPFLGVCYALGFGCGNALGILAERKIALGNVIVRIISLTKGEDIAQALRQAGFCVTAIPGQGSTGPVALLFVVCRRRDMRQLLAVAQAIDPTAFHTFDSAAGANKVHRPACRKHGSGRVSGKRLLRCLLPLG